MRLSEIKGEQAIDVLADLLDPIAEVLTDKEFINAFNTGEQKIKIVRLVLKKHKKAALTALAVLDGVDPEEYKPSLIEIPKKLLDLLNDPELTNLFPSAPQTSQKISSVRASENTEGGEQ